MNIILWIIVGIITLIVVALLTVQFIKIGSILKRKIPFLYAIYLIFWILFFGLSSILGVIVIQQEIQNKKERVIKQERQEQIAKHAIHDNVSKEGARVAIQTMEIACNHCYLSDKEKYIFLHLSKTSNISQFVKKAKQQGFNDKEIAEYYGLYIYDNITAQDAVQFGKKHNAPNDGIYNSLVKSGLLDEYLSTHNEQQIKQMFNLQ